MLFNSISFAIFLPVVFAAYWLARRNMRLQNMILLLSSCYFYGSWDARFLLLLLFSISLDYFMGIQMENSQTTHEKKFWLCLSVCVNVGFLALFKYYNFFEQSFSQLLQKFGLQVHFWTLKVILPVGISFYTFHGLSYVFDVYKKKIPAERNFVCYSVFVSFFPLLVAGPIERATHLLPQIRSPRYFEYAKAVDGLRQILWGLFKKMVIADNCAVFANLIFDHQSAYSGSTLAIGALFFTFQIYCDFSGYSDIAIGTAHLFGIDLLRNFAFPYFSRDIAEFWRRWHMSLSSWFRDYLYIPLGGSKVNSWLKARNTLIIFVVSGFWHGANWTFIAWGLLNAIYIMPYILLKTNRNHLDIVAQQRSFPTVKETLSIFQTFLLTVFAWIFFRSQSLHQAFAFIAEIFSKSLFYRPVIDQDGLILLLTIVAFLAVEWLGRRQQYAIAHIDWILPRPVRWTVYFGLVVSIIYLSGREEPFIYFQF